MPRTTVIRQTAKCPECRATWDTYLLVGRPCPYCKATVERETNAALHGTLTIVGPEELEEEVLHRTETVYRARGQAIIGATIARMDTAGEFATVGKRNQALAAALAALEDDIARRAHQGFFLPVTAQAPYLAARQLDIQQAIQQAKVREAI